jgi:predicted RNase H-like HicB family nuclease
LDFVVRIPMTIEVELESDGRFIAEVPEIPGAMAYGATQEQAIAKVEALVLRILADRLDHGDPSPQVSEVFTIAA